MGPLVDSYYISIQYTKDTGRRVLRQSNSPNLLNRCLCALCHHPVPITRTSTDQSTFMGYPSEDCQASFVDNSVFCFFVATSLAISIPGFALMALDTGFSVNNVAIMANHEELSPEA